LAGIEDDGFLQAGTESLFQEAQTVQVLAANAGPCLDLEGDDLAVGLSPDSGKLLPVLRALDSRSPQANFRKSTGGEIRSRALWKMEKPSRRRSVPAE
jgi:hypothetical protein